MAATSTSILLSTLVLFAGACAPEKSEDANPDSDRADTSDSSTTLEFEASTYSRFLIERWSVVGTPRIAPDGSKAARARIFHDHSN